MEMRVRIKIWLGNTSPPQGLCGAFLPQLTQLCSLVCLANKQQIKCDIS
jgi:hypothetical protein